MRVPEIFTYCELCIFVKPRKLQYITEERHVVGYIDKMVLSRSLDHHCVVS